jgi:hypothetical protein
MTYAQSKSFGIQITGMGFHPIIDREGSPSVRVSAEYDDWACYYYDAPSMWEFGINPQLTAFAKEVGGHFEWDDPGSISLYLD